MKQNTTNIILKKWSNTDSKKRQQESFSKLYKNSCFRLLYFNLVQTLILIDYKKLKKSVKAEKRILLFEKVKNNIKLYKFKESVTKENLETGEKRIRYYFNNYKPYSFFQALPINPTQYLEVLIALLHRDYFLVNSVGVKGETYSLFLVHRSAIRKVNGLKTLQAIVAGNKQTSTQVLYVTNLFNFKNLAYYDNKS